MKEYLYQLIHSVEAIPARIALNQTNWKGPGITPENWKTQGIQLTMNNCQ